MNPLSPIGETVLVQCAPLPIHCSGDVPRRAAEDCSCTYNDDTDGGPAPWHQACLMTPTVQQRTSLCVSLLPYHSTFK